jgi:hypothetical protein
VAASALDGRPLAQSRKILVFQLPDLQNTKMKYGNRAHTRLEAWGELPHLVRRGQAEVSLAVAEGKYEVKALALDGTEKAAIPARYADGVLQFTADTAAAGGTLAYLVTAAP